MKKIVLICTMTLMALTVAKGQSNYSNNPDNDFKNGKIAFLEHNYAISSKYFKQFLDNNDKDKTCALCEEAEYYMAINSYFLKDKNAMNILKEFIEKNPNASMRHYVNYYIGRLYYEKGKWTHVLKYYDQVNEDNLSFEDSEDFVFSKGYSHLMLKEYKNASKSFISLIGTNRIYTKEAEYYYAYSEFCLKNYKTALETFINMSSNSKYYEAALFHALQIYDQLHYRSQAVELGKYLINKYPNSTYLSEAYRILGENSFFKQNWSDAAQYLSIYSKGQPKVQRSDMYMLGISYYKTKEYPQAIKALGKVTTEKDSLAQNAYIFIGNSYLQSEQTDNARMAFQNASLIDADHTLQEEALYNYTIATYDSKAPFGERIKAFEKFIENYPNSSHINTIYELMADGFLTDKNYAGAIESIDKIANPSQKLLQAKEHAYLHLGIAAFNKHKYKDAIANFKKSIALNSSKSFSSQVYLWLGETYYLKKDHEQARKNIQKFLDSKQGKTANQIEKAYYTMAYSYFDSKDYSHAISYFKTFNKIQNAKKSSVYNDVQNRIGDCYFLQREFSAARKVYNSIDPNAKGADYAKFQNAFILGLQKQYSAKIDELNKFIKKYPRSEYNDDAMYEIGHTYVLQEKYTAAINAYKQLQVKYPKSKLTRKASLEIGMQYANLNQNDNAIDAYKYVIKNYPASEEARVALESMQSLCIDENRVDEFLTYRNSLTGIVIADVEKSDEDSISFIAAERAYARGNYNEAIKSLDRYIVKFCKGQTLNCITAQYYLAESLYHIGDTERALTYYDKLANIDGNEYMEEVLLKASSIAYDKKDYKQAKVYFEGLYKNAEQATNKYAARLGILRCSYFTKQNDATIQIASEILQDSNAEEDIIREAHYCRAKAYLAKQESDMAVKDLTAISNDISYEIGAEAKYLYAEHLYLREDYKGSEDIIMEFIQEGTPFQYWLAKCFILLSDIYLAQDDEFMAKQYLLSLQENYTAEDDIQEMIQIRLEDIKARESEKILE